MEEMLAPLNNKQSRIHALLGIGPRNSEGETSE